jgi:CBS domain containing-hemolysin-like protein
MQKLLREESKEPDEGLRESPRALLATRVLGFLGSAVICWIALRMMAPVMASLWGIAWINNLWVKIGIVSVASLAIAAVLSRIEGTIWGRYYVIVGYLLSLGLIVWLVLHLLNYV